MPNPTLPALVRAFLADYPPATCHPCAESRRLARGRPSPQAVEAGRRLAELLSALEAAEAAGGALDVRSRTLDPAGPKTVPLFREEPNRLGFLPPTCFDPLK